MINKIRKFFRFPQSAELRTAFGIDMDDLPYFFQCGYDAILNKFSQLLLRPSSINFFVGTDMQSLLKRTTYKIQFMASIFLPTVFFLRLGRSLISHYIDNELSFFRCYRE